MPVEELVVHGAREHNLKDVTVRLPRNALICITGLSGSGKSSLAFDTIYAEGQRRYVESLSAYARQFLQMMEKPDVDSIDGLSPAISIDQKTTSRNPRSTVGTVTEIYDYLRLLYARVGRPHCPVCGRPIAGQSLDQIVEQILALPEGDAVHRQRADRARPQGRVPRRARGAPPRRLHARQGRRRAAAARGGDRPRQEVQAHDRGRRRPARAQARPAAAPDPVGRDRHVARRRARRRRRRRRREPPLLRELRLPRARRLAARARAAHLLVQRAARRLPALHRARGAARDRPGHARSRHVRLGRGRRTRAVVGRQLELLRGRDPGDRRPLRDRHRPALARSHGGAAGLVPLRHERRPDPRPVQEPDGPQAPVRDGVRGHPAQPRAALPRDRVGPAARADRGVHELPAVPGLQRRAPQAGRSRGHRRRPLDPRVHATLGRRRAPLPRRPRADSDRGADRAPDREGDPRAAHVPLRRRRRLPPARPRREDAVGRRGAAAAARDADRLAARRRPLHPRRAVDRAPPARQRPADRDAAAPEGARQHGARRRARRADDARRRLGRRHGPGRR